MARSPGDYRAWCDIGNLLYSKRRYEEAISAWERAGELAYGRIPELEKKLQTIEASEGKSGAVMEEAVPEREYRLVGALHPNAGLAGLLVGHADRAVERRPGVAVARVERVELRARVGERRALSQQRNAVACMPSIGGTVLSASASSTSCTVSATTARPPRRTVANATARFKGRTATSSAARRQPPPRPDLPPGSLVSRSSEIRPEVSKAPT